MKKIKRGDFWMLDADQMWEVVDSLQSELEALEGRQGFVPDWSKAPNGTVGYVAFFTGSEESYWKRGTNGGDNVSFIPRPLPPKVTRERTREEMIDALKETKNGSAHAFYAIVSTWHSAFSDSTLKDLCTAAGIPTTTEEV